MHNKKHNIIDDAWEMREELLGGPEHTMRVGLIVNTVINSMPVVIPDISKLMEVPENFKVDFDNLTDFNVPVLLHTDRDGFQVAVLIVRDKDSHHIQCFPFSTSTNEEGYWWAYDMAFDLVPGGAIEIRPVNPIMELNDAFSDPTEPMMAHLEALAIMVSAFLYQFQNKSFTLEEDVEDFSKINKKRLKNKKSEIESNWIPKYV